MAKLNIRNRNESFPNRAPNWEYRFEGAKVEGKRKAFSKSGFKTKKDAFDAGTKALAAYNNAGIHFTPSEVGVSDFLDHWFASYVKLNTTYNTQVSYANIIERHLKPYFGQFKLKSLSPMGMQEFVNEVNSKGYSKSLVYGILSLLQNALDYAVFPLEYIRDNPMRYIKYKYTAEKPIRERVVLKDEQFAKILEMYPFGDKHYLPLLLGWYCGLRISEMCALTWSDINFDFKTLTVNKQIVRRNIRTDKQFIKKLNENKEKAPKGWYFTTPKFNSQRTIKLSDSLIEILQRVHKQQLKDQKKYKDMYFNYIEHHEKDEKGKDITRLVPTQKMFVKKEHKTICFVCRDENGKMMTPEQFAPLNKRVKLELEIPFDYHSLRHTHATLLIESGVNVKTVQVRLGHKNVTTTLQKYVHDTQEMQDMAVKIFENHASMVQSDQPNNFGWSNDTKLRLVDAN